MLDSALSVLLLFALGIPGWYLLERLSVPAATVIGPMMSIALFTALGVGPPELPYLLRPSLQILVGLFIGTRISASFLRSLRRMALPACLVSSWWVASGLILGWALFQLSHLEMKTAFLGSAPGGMVEMSILAVSLGGDAAVVALLQFFRVAIALVAVPLLGPRVFRHSAWRRETAATSEMPDSRLSPGPSLVVGQSAGGTGGEDPLPQGQGPGWTISLLGQLRTLILAAVGGTALYLTGMPAGGLIGAMAGVGVVKISGCPCPEPPDIVRLVARLGLGGMIGLNLTLETLAGLAQIAWPVTLLTVTMLLNGFLLALVLRRLTGWAMETCVLSTSAAGLSQMSLIADDLGADPAVVAMMHLVRLMTIIIVMPPLFGLLLSL